MPNLRGKTWTETTPAKTEDANFWESHLIDDESYEGLQDLLEGGAGGGHVIVNGAGTEMPQQPKLQFVNATVTNGNGVTIVSGNGEKGDAATVTVGTTTTGAAGTNASVTNSGTEYDAVLNFVIPRGADGEGVPSGGTTGQVLTKASNTDGDVTWTTPAGGATWGSITGTLSNQTDLQNALDSAGKVKAVDGFSPDTTTGNVTTERVLTQAQYDALSEAEKNNGMTYYISDGEGGGGGSTTAAQVSYSNTQSGLSATNVQGAIDELRTLQLGSLAIVSGTLSSATGWGDYTAFPTGFNSTNSCIIGWEVLYYNVWRTGIGFVEESRPTRFMVGYDTNGVRAYNNDAQLYGAQYRAVLYKYQ